MNQGHLFIISGPSGVGKSTIAKMAVKTLGDKISKLPTYTTRKPRTGEINGKDYLFIDKNKFKDFISSGEILESNLFNNNYYGTSKTEIDNAIINHKNILLILDIHGATAIKKIYPETTSIFLTTNMKDIENRLRSRGQNTESEIKDRLNTAKSELKAEKLFDYIIKNSEGHPETAAKGVAKIIQDMIR